MQKIEVGRVYRHFKGTYIYIKDIGYDSETEEECVVYQHLEDNKIWVRKLNMFLEKIDDKRSDNITGQQCRFQLVDLNKNK